MPLSIEDDETAQLVTRLAAQRGITKQDAVELAVTSELACAIGSVPLQDRFAAWRAAHPLPPPTGELADKALFDELSGDL